MTEALRTELAAHQRRLALLRERAALQGITVDPAVTIEIAQIEQQIRTIEAQLAGLPSPSASSAPDDWQAALPTAGGDVIVANIGAGAQHIAVGKQITQTAAGGPESPLPALDALTAAFDQLRPTLAAPLAEMAAFQLNLLRGELSKLPPELPSATTIVAVGGWLQSQVPQLIPALIVALQSPSLSASLSRAGAQAVAWAAQLRAAS